MDVTASRPPKVGFINEALFGLFPLALLAIRFQSIEAASNPTHSGLT